LAHREVFPRLFPFLLSFDFNHFMVGGMITLVAKVYLCVIFPGIVIDAGHILDALTDFTPDTVHTASHQSSSFSSSSGPLDAE
jgi:hypothetical protein